MGVCRKNNGGLLVLKRMILTSSVLLSALIACGGGQSATGSGIRYPGNLVADTSTIVKSGKSVIKISNVGQLPVVINSVTLSDNETVDSIESTTTDCNGKTLSENQTCNLGLDVYSGEAGISTLALATSNGIYTMSLNIDTSGEGVVDSDIKALQTTKEQVINIVNKGAAPLILTNLVLESSNTTLHVADINCLNQTLTQGQACQIKAQATAAQNQQHILYLNTANKFLHTQQLMLNEDTDKNMLSLFAESGDTNPIVIESPGVKVWRIVNSGSDDVHIKDITLDADNIANITANDCSNKLLEAGDSCNITMNIRQNAFALGRLFINTQESLISESSYALMLASDNLTVKDSANDVAMHTNSEKTLTIENNSNFDITVESIEFNSQEVKLSSDCIGVVPAHANCTLQLSSLALEDDNSRFIFHEFNGQFSKQINVHIDDGVYAINQPDSSIYNSVLPRDNYFYQVFTIHNPTNQDILPTVLLRDTSIHAVHANELPSNMFILPSCISATGSAYVAANSDCELVLRELADYNALQDIIADMNNPDKGNLRFRLNYSSGDLLLQKFQGVLMAHNMHRAATYQPGELILADQAIGANNSCGVYNSLATIVSNTSDSYGNSWSSGFVIHADLLDKNTISVAGFAGSNNQCSATIAKVPLLLQSTYKTDTEIAHFQYDPLNALSLHILPGSYCQLAGGDCVLNITLHQVGLNGVHYDYVIASRVLTFVMPLSATDVMVADKVNWQSLANKSDNR